MKPKQIWEELTRFFPLIPYAILLIVSEIKDAEWGITLSFVIFLVLLIKIGREGKGAIKNFSLVELISLSSLTVLIFLSFFLSEGTIKLLAYTWIVIFAPLVLFFKIKKRRESESS